MKPSITITATALIGMFMATNASAWTTVEATPFDINGVGQVQQIRASGFSDPAFGYQGWAHQGRWGTFNAVKGKQYKIVVDGRANVGVHPAVALWKRPIGTPTQPYTYWDGDQNKFVSLTNLTPAVNVPDHFFFPMQSYIESGVAQQHVMESSGGGSDCQTQWTRTINGTTITAPNCSFWSAALRTKDELAAQPGVLLEDGTTDIGYPRMLFAKAVYDADRAGKMWNTLNVNPLLEQQRDGKQGFLTLQFTADETSQYEFFVGAMNPDPGTPVAWYNVDVSVKR